MEGGRLIEVGLHKDLYGKNPYKDKPLYGETTVYLQTHKTDINRPVDYTGET